MRQLSDILAQLTYGYELRQITAELEDFDVAHLISVAFFLAVLTSLGLIPYLAGRIRTHRQPRHLHLFGEERRVVQWWRRLHPEAFARSGSKTELC